MDYSLACKFDYFHVSGLFGFGECAGLELKCLKFSGCKGLE